MGRGGIGPVLAVLSAVLAIGCEGDKHPPRVAVTGKVIYKGAPVAGAEVVFRNDRAPRASYGTTNAEGVYTLTTYEPNDGAIPGPHVVTIKKLAAAAKPITDLTSPEYAEAMKAMSKGPPKSELPAKYGDPGNQDMLRTVKAGEENRFDFDLKD